jgi:protein-tyrosine phosphatase
MDISFIAEHLWIASKFYELDEDMPPNHFLIDLETIFSDEPLTSETKSATKELTEEVQILRGMDFNVVLQCKAGRNRSGLIAAMCLIADGLSPQQALDQIRAARTSLRHSGGALTNESFRAFILSNEPSRATTE